jgi:two-component system, cell cycle sensor histidine kinase and response regulator CckA
MSERISPGSVWERASSAIHIAVPLAAAIVMWVVTTGVLLAQLMDDQQQTRLDRQHIVQRYAEIARPILAEAMVTADTSRAAGLLRNLAPPDSELSAALLDRDRRVILASVPAWKGQPLEAVAPEAASLPYENGAKGDSSGGGQLHLILPWVANSSDDAGIAGSRPAWLYIGADIRARLRQQSDHLLLRIAMAFALVAVAALVLGWWLHARFTRPIEMVRRSALPLLATPRQPVAGAQVMQRSRSISQLITETARHLDALHDRLAEQAQAQQLQTECLDAMLGAGSAQQAMQGVCDALVRQGLHAAWVSLGEPPGNSLRIAARAGHCDHLGELPGASPPEAAILAEVVATGHSVRHVVLGAGPESAGAWMVEAIRNGCTELILVPVTGSRENIGALTLLSPFNPGPDMALDAVLTELGRRLGERIMRLRAFREDHALKDQLDRERSLLRAVIDSIPDLIFFKDQASIYLGCNKAFERLVNRAEIDVIGGSDFELFRESQAEAFRRDDALVLSDRLPRRIKEWVEYPDGARVMLESTKTPYLSADGRILGLVGISRDVTKAVQLEESLAERVKELRGLYDVMRTLAAHGDDIPATLAAVVDELPRAFRLPELAAVRLICGGSTFHAGEAVPGGPAIRVPVAGPLDEKDALEVSYPAAALPDGDPGFLAEEHELVQAVAAELARFLERQALVETERRSAQEMRARERRLQAVIESSRDLIYEFEPASGHRTWYANPLAALGFGETHDDASASASASDWRRYLHPRDLPSFEQATTAGAGLEQGYDVSYRVRTVDGTWRYWRDRGKQVGEAGHEPRVVGSCADVTDIVTSAESRTLVDRRLRQGERLETLGLLTRGISAELNGKLMAIRGYAALLVKKLDTLPGEKMRARLENIQVSADEAAALLAEVNRFSDAGETGSFPILVKPIVDSAVALLRPALPAGLRLTASLEPALPMILARQSEILQVLLNLGLHLKRAIGENGQIEIRGALVQLEGATCSACGAGFAGKWIELAVRSESATPASAVIPQIFDPSRQAEHYGRTDAFELATVHRLVSGNRGHLVVDVQSTGVEGYRVYLRPHRVAAGDGLDGRECGTLESADVGAGRVALLIDQNASWLELLSRQLDLFGFTVVAYDAVESGLEYLSRHPGTVSLVAVDGQAAGESGSALQARVRAASAATPMLILSGDAEAKPDGGDPKFAPCATLVPPFPLCDLDQALSRLFEQS